VFASLLVGLVMNGLVIAPGAAVNVSWPELQYCDEGITTQSLLLVGSLGEQVTFGVEDLAGGIGNSMITSGFGSSLNGRNLIATGAGRSAQNACWDWAHGQHYNCDQGGASRNDCTQTVVSSSVPGILAIKQFDMATFGEPGEPALRSEQNFTESLQDRTAMTGGVPSIQVNAVQGYLDVPSAIAAFSTDYNASLAIQDADLVAAGNQATSADDLSFFEWQYTFYVNAADFSYIGYRSGGVWTFVPSSGTNFNSKVGVQNKGYKFVSGAVANLHNFTSYGADFDMYCLASANDMTAKLICEHFGENGPDSDYNVNQSRFADGSKKNWLIDAFFRAHKVQVQKADCLPSQLQGSKCYLATLSFFDDTSALFAPVVNWQADTMRGLLLFCTSPARCDSGIDYWEAQGYTGDEP
jgi:hypothetical protein